MNSTELLKSISQNLHKIANERDSLKKECESKDDKIGALEKEVQELSARMNSASEANNNLQSSTMTSKNEEIKTQIDGLVDEIDECIALLNK